MILAQETTKWSHNVPNHIYVLNDSKTAMYAYINARNGEEKYFKNPIQIDTRGRTFTILKRVKEGVPQVEVKGSKGDIYFVRKENDMLTCTCQGFKFRGECKHLEIAKDEFPSS